MNARRRKPDSATAKPPEAGAPEHPVDPADAAFLDPGSAADAHPASAGYGDYEGERPDAGGETRRKDERNRRA